MDQAAMILGYLVMSAVCGIVACVAAYWTIKLIMDAIGARKVFLEMKKERNDAWAELRKINEESTEARRQEVRDQLTRA